MFVLCLSTGTTDPYLEVVGQGGEIGFAVRLPSGRFGVSRFSLNGGVRATGHAMEMAIEKQQRSQQGLRDFTI